ncbi:pol-like protein [Apostichopus japonicus]|uniref:Pol-like protein n=1 Tax=Stichopus japonicus TaxID=307972 RepID=A0A2G8KB68_STIJA|nr:pol-like protein [Apostichopus japonicus]
MKNGKSPGSDGLPREFYRTFWAIIGPDIRAVFEDAFQNGLLNQSQRLGMITLLPKSGDPLDPRNKRPITLLNVDYKLLAKALCNRLALAMPHLVGDLQTCAVKGHCIQQNLWLMRDLTDFVIERDLPCALVSLDQQKAFDMVDRGFLMNVLETFQLHPNFRKWISVLYQESFSSVIVNGFCSEVFNVERGVRQGCPLSPLLYVLFSESLSRLLERDSRLVPFVVPGGAKVKCAQYADDVTCVVSSLGSFRALSQDLSIFERATGAKLNPEKTKGLRLGSWRYRDLPFGASWSDQNIKINGIWFGYDAPVMSPGSERAEVFESRLETFGTRWLSILGKVTVVNRFVSPILWYPGAVYPIPRRVLVRLERAIFSFIWSGGTELVKRAECTKNWRRVVRGGSSGK